MLLYIVYMMDCCSFLVLSSLLAYLAFIFIKLQDFFSFRFPFAPCVESMYVFFYAFFYKLNVVFCHDTSLMNCRRRTRTSDFQLRRLASFQLLYPAIYVVLHRTVCRLGFEPNNAPALTDRTFL